MESKRGDLSDQLVHAPTHDPSLLDPISEIGEWAVYGFQAHHACHDCLAASGRLYLLLVHQDSHVSVVTPCIQTNARFEVSISGQMPVRIDGIDTLDFWLKDRLELTPPPRAQLLAAARWFIDRPEMQARRSVSEGC